MIRVNKDLSVFYSLRIFLNQVKDNQLVVFHLEPEWQKVSSGVQDYSQYSGRSQPRCVLYGLDSVSDFQFFNSFPQSFLCD